MKTRILTTLLALGSVPAFVAVGCADSFKDCENTLTCDPPEESGGTGGTGGGNGDGDGGTGGGIGGAGGGDPVDPCDACPADKPECNDDDQCVECTENNHCSGGTPFCVDESCGECAQNTDCDEVDASLCDGGSCTGCTQDDDCAHLTDTPVCDEVSNTCVECTTDTEEDECGEFSCSSLSNTCTTTTRGILGTCEACEADSECGADRKCVMDQFEGEEVGYFCFLEQGVTGCGNVESTRRPYRSIVETTSIDGLNPVNFCLPPNSTTCQGIQDTQSVVCSSDDDCGVEGLDDGYCPTVGDGAGACTYNCGGGFDCASLLECTGSPQHCNPE